MKSGQVALMTVAGNTWTQYNCCSGIVASSSKGTNIASEPKARIHCAASLEIIQAARIAAADAQTGTGDRPKAVDNTVQWRMFCCQAIMYQMKVPYAMKLKRTTIIRAVNEGALKIFRGRMGCAVNLHSQIAKAAKNAKAKMRRTIS